MSFLGKPKVPTGRFMYRGEDKYSGMSLQLRVEADKRGVLVINANTVLHLNKTATAFAYFFMQGQPEAKVVAQIRRIYRVDADKAKADYEKLVYTISTLAQTEKIDPVTFLEIEKEEPFSYQYSAPLRMDLALTFRCQNDCIHCYAGGPHETTELNTTQWKTVLDRLSEVGVFIVTFTGGEPTIRDDLPELLLYAQNKGMVTGLISNGRRLKDPTYVEMLEKAGLDFVQITLESHKPEVHDKMTNVSGSWQETMKGIKNATQSQIYVSTNTTLSKKNAADFLTTIDFIKSLGVDAFGTNSLIYSGKAPDAQDEFALSTDELTTLLPQVRDKAIMLGLKFLWYTPTQYCEFDPTASNLGVKGCTAALYSMCVESNGDVLPCQSYYYALGNMLTDPWESIWNHELSVRLRERQGLPSKCDTCILAAECGGGCPLQFAEAAHSISTEHR